MRIEHTAVLGYGLRLSTRELGFFRRSNGNQPLYDIFPSPKFLRLDYVIGATSKGHQVCFIGIGGTLVSIHGSGIGAFDPEDLEEAIDDTSYEELATVALEGQVRRDPAWLLFLHY